MTGKVWENARNVAIVGPYSSGKTTLLESLLALGGAISRKGSIKEGNTVGDSAAEARERQMQSARVPSARETCPRPLEPIRYHVPPQSQRVAGRGFLETILPSSK